MTWQLEFVLNNLGVRSAFESEYIAIVGPSDARLRTFSTAHPSGAALLAGFSDIRGQRVSVSALMLRDDAPDSYKTAEAMYSFRNIYAFSSIVSALQEQIRDQNNWSTVYSTFFDFYPVQLDKNNDALITSSAAVRGWDDAASFNGQPDPAIVNTSLLQPEPDLMVKQPLLDAWTRHVENQTTNRELTVLFRSLEVAYQAASLPRSNSIHEYGSRIALWVSAIEILAHPPNGDANLGTVLNLLDAGTWHDARLRDRRYVVRYRQQPPRRRFVGKLYRELYRARNDFLHGNQVSSARLFPFKKQVLPPLPRTAALVYKAALLAFVDQLRDKRRTRAKKAQGLHDVWERRIFEECLVKAGGLAP